LEQEGTYPLPEAQLDRFLLYIRVDYPSGSEEWDIARRVTSGSMGAIEACMSGEEIMDLQRLVNRVPISDQVLGYAWALVRASRPGSPEASAASEEYATWKRSDAGADSALPDVQDFVDRWINWGAGPRGLLTLVTCAKARAILHGRFHATTADVQALAKPALRHRIAGNYTAQANNVGSERLIEMLMQAVPADREYARPAA
jgi:MoxR-like ATPase